MGLEALHAEVAHLENLKDHAEALADTTNFELLDIIRTITMM